MAALVLLYGLNPLKFAEILTKSEPRNGSDFYKISSEFQRIEIRAILLYENAAIRPPPVIFKNAKVARLAFCPNRGGFFVLDILPPRILHFLPLFLKHSNYQLVTKML